MGVSNTLGVKKGKVEGSPSITAIVIASRAASVGVCSLLAGRSQHDKAAMQAHSLERDKLTKTRKVSTKPAEAQQLIPRAKR
jgi:hypothetical protein